ncbi:MAG: hypothetical protein ACKV0T_10555 [Planctomycetales bacterium]
MVRRILAVLALVSLTSSLAQAGFNTHYTVVMQPDTLGIAGVVKFEEGDTFGGASWPDYIQGGADGPSETIINQIFASDQVRVRSLLLGVSYDGYTSPPVTNEPPAEGKHLVMIVSNWAAGLMVGKSFDELFADYSEADVINWLEIVGQVGEAIVGPDVFGESADHLSEFAQYTKTALVDGESTVSAWFDVPLPNADPLPFTVVQFSQGTQVGAGTVTQTTTVPEPGMLLSLLAVSAIVPIRRRK